MCALNEKKQTFLMIEYYAFFNKVFLLGNRERSFSSNNIDNVGLSGSSITQIVAAVFIHNELWLGGAATIIIIVYMRARDDEA